MLRAVKKILLAALLVSGLQGARGFSLLGPTGNGGDSWQTITIGYNLPYLMYVNAGGPVALGDIGGPKNIGEEFRRNTPTVYYAYNANFLTYFGSNGVAAVDGSFGIMNSLTNVSLYSSDLSEFPLNAQDVNPTAQALGLTDLKSATLHLLVEQLGLAEPERYTWTLHNRYLPSGGTCPIDELYLVVQRNFDIINSPLNQVQYSPYVNGTLYSYVINEVCSGSPTLAWTEPFPVAGPLTDVYTAVAANNYYGLNLGGFYTGLTRDDVAGLRYLLSPSNLNYESPASGSQMFTTNTLAQTTLTTLDLGTLIEQAKTNPPVVLQAIYPDLNFTLLTNYLQAAVSTNLLPYYTNYPGPTVTNYASQPGILLTNYDLNSFITFSHTNDPATMLATYPGLQILSYTSYWTNYLTPNVQFTVERLIGGTIGSYQIKLVTNGYSPNFYLYYNYVFGNLLTNSYKSYTSNKLVTVMLTNMIGAPYTGATVIGTNVIRYKDTNTPSGDFFIIPTNWCGFSVLSSSLWAQATSVTNILSSSASTNATTLTTNGVTYEAYQYVQHTYTNRIWVVAPGVCEPTLQYETNITTNIVSVYKYSFGNIVTNSYFTNSPVTIITTNIAACAGNPAGVYCTNVTSSTYYTNRPSGDFYIIPTNWCGYSILSTALTTVVYTTNTYVIISTNSTSTNSSLQFIQSIITSFTNHTFIVQPQTCDFVDPPAALWRGVDRVQFVRANYDSLVGQFFQPITNVYTMILVTNSQNAVRTFRRVITAPDIVLTAEDLATGPAGNGFNGSVERSISFDEGNVLSGLAGPGVINPRATFTYNKVGTIYWNGSLALTTNAYLSEFTHFSLIAWASFDASTNAPVVYPDGTSIASLENMLLIQISPTSLADGTVGTPYSVNFSATGGQPPYTWALADTNALPSGLTFSSSGLLSGTPTTAGTYDLVIQLTDSGNRVVQLNYSLTIQ